MGETLPALIPDLVKLGTRAAEFARNSRAPATELAYRSDWGGGRDVQRELPRGAAVSLGDGILQAVQAHGGGATGQWSVDAVLARRASAGPDASGFQPTRTSL